MRMDSANKIRRSLADIHENYNLAEDLYGAGVGSDILNEPIPVFQ